MLSRQRWIQMGVVALGWPLLQVVAAEPTSRDLALERLRGEVAAMRRDLAATRLELKRAVEELDELRDFAASEDPAEDAERWRRERNSLAEERERLADERRRLEQPPELTGTESPSPQPQPEEANLQPTYDLDYTLSFIRRGADDERVYVDFGDLIVPASSQPDIERDRVMVRGTLRNRSDVPWRYTFEVRLADRYGYILGNWHYQTPLLSPNELHAFDVEVPVTDAALIRKYQIGNLEADQPENENPKERDRIDEEKVDD